MDSQIFQPILDNNMNINLRVGWLYILLNPCYNVKNCPLVKVGCTRSLDRTPEKRALELYTTGVPHPFKVQYAIKINSNINDVESSIHSIFSDKRYNQSREFFLLSENDIKNLVKLCVAFGTEVHEEPTKKRFISDEEDEDSNLHKKQRSENMESIKPRRIVKAKSKKIVIKPPVLPIVDFQI